MPASATDPVREAEPVFCAIARLTVAEPVPVDAPATEIQLTDGEAVHEHSALVEIPTETFVGAGPTETPLLVSEDVHVLPAWETVKLRPATTSVPTREKDAVFGATVYCTVPSPSPDAPDPIVIHDTLLDAVHAHPEELETSIAPVDPAALIEIDVGVKP